MRWEAMVEILSCELSKAIQLVGFVEKDTRLVPVRVLFALSQDGAWGDFTLRGLWLTCANTVPLEALEDLVSECLPGSWKKIPPVGTGKCALCGRPGQRQIVTSQGRNVCWEHLGCLWEEILVTQAARGSISGNCAKCGLAGVVLWGEKGHCTRCMVEDLRGFSQVTQWVLLGGSPMPARGQKELVAFLEAWRRVGACPRCGSRAIRVRRLVMDFPRAKGPLYPLWDLTREDMKPERMLLRDRQLRLFTEGLMRATVECAQCGYMDLEYPGLESFDEGEFFFPLF
ncbi:MAG: hypothetical protein WHX93_08175 [bacterium]